MTTQYVNSYASLKAALDAFKTGAPPYTIRLTGNLTDSGAIGGTLTIPEGKSVEISSNDGTLYALERKAGFTGVMFNIPKNAKLTLQTVDIAGNEEPLPDGARGSDESNALITLNGAGAVLTLNDGVILQNNKNTVTNGGAIMASAGTVNMNSGSQISNNSAKNGGAIALSGTAQLNMNGGLITANKATVDGGAIAGIGLTSGHMTIKGNITYNRAERDGDGIFVPYAALDRVKFADGEAFSNNNAGRSGREPQAFEEALYARQGGLKVASWTSPYNQGYNNHDVAFRNGPSGGGGGGGGGGFGPGGGGGAGKKPLFKPPMKRASCNPNVIWCSSTNYCACLFNSKR